MSRQYKVLVGMYQGVVDSTGGRYSDTVTTFLLLTHAPMLL